MEIPEDSCWEWSGYRNADGYGQVRDGDKMIRAHRYSWLTYKGDIPKGKYVLHKCDNPGCINPHHLFLGDQKDNMLDMKQKGRANHPIGILNGRAKLDVEKVKQIIELKKRGYLHRELAGAYGVGTSTISRVLRRENWNV